MEKVRADVTAMAGGGEGSFFSSVCRQLAVASRRRSLVIQTIGGLTSILLLVTVFTGTAPANPARQPCGAGRPAQQRATQGREQRDAFVFLFRRPRSPRAIARHQRLRARDRRGPRSQRCLTKRRRALGRITSNASMMGQIIDDLLSLSKISYQPLRSAKVEMNELVRGAYQELAETHPGRVIECEIGDLPPASGDAEPAAAGLDQPHRQRHEVHARAEARSIEIGGNVAGPEFATYFIRDNGAGFDMQYAGQAVRGVPALHRPAEFEGTGIGLALVQRIIHRHGGTIWAEGQVGSGRAVRVYPARMAWTDTCREG